MTGTGVPRVVLLADISGSTPLYETFGDVEAARRVGRCIDFMRGVVDAAGGAFVAARGDDVLATFESAEAALAAVETILAEMPMDGLMVHAGLHFGRIVPARDDIFGDAVNLTARLAAIANPGEVLISRELVMQLRPARAGTLRRLSAMRLKGKTAPVDVFSLVGETRFHDTGRKPGAAEAACDRLSARLEFADGSRQVAEGESVSLGRAPDNDIVIARPWVSRRHATIAVAGGRVQLTDRSSYGTYLAIADAAELVARRETVVITGSGRLSPGVSVESPDATVIVIEMSLR